MKEVKLKEAIIGIGFGMTLTVILAILIFVGISMQYPSNLQNYFYTTEYHIFSKYASNDSVVVNITNFCNFPMSEYKQVDCVVTQVQGFFNYSKKNRTDYGIKTPSEIKKTGGLCRDYAVMYDSIFRNLGYETEYQFLPEHVYNVITMQNSSLAYCTIDQNSYKCYLKKTEEN